MKEKSSTSSGVVSWPSNGSRTTSPRSKPSAKSARLPSARQSTTAKSGKRKRGGRPPGGKNRARLDDLLKRLGVNVAFLNSQAQVTPLLKQCGILPARIIEVLRADHLDESRVVVGVWDSLTRAERGIIGMDALAVASGVTPRRLWEMYSGATMIQSRESLGVLIADSLPAIMKVTIKEAKKVKGYSSREHIFKAARVLPTPKGSVINIGVPNGKSEDDDDDGDDDESAKGGMLESADDFLMRASRAMGAKALPAPTPEPEILDPEEDEEE